MKKLLVTGFGAFGAVDENPSSWLAEHSGQAFQILDVSYSAVEEFLQSFDSESYYGLLCLGVAAKAEKMRLEMLGKNAIGETQDIHGIAGPSRISLASGQLASNLWSSNLLATPPEDVEVSDNAGHYLCNFLLFKALNDLPHIKVGFLHVTLPEVISLDRQLEVVKLVIEECSP